MLFALHLRASQSWPVISWSAPCPISFMLAEARPQKPPIIRIPTEPARLLRLRYQRTGCIPSTLSILLIPAIHRISLAGLRKAVHKCASLWILFSSDALQITSVMATSNIVWQRVTRGTNAVRRLNGGLPRNRSHLIASPFGMILDVSKKSALT